MKDLNRFRTTAHVDLDAAAWNLKQLKRWLGPTRLMAVIKADAYGHGAIRYAELCEAQGVDYLGVATPVEAIELQDAGIKLPILVLSLVQEALEEAMVERGIRTTVSDLQQMERYAHYAKHSGKRHPIHIKVNTGMNRIGFAPDESEKVAAAIQSYANELEVEGVFTHFACADQKDRRSVDEQYARYLQFTQGLETQGISDYLRHVTNSATTLKYPELHLDMARVGLAIYGVLPETTVNDLNLRPVTTFTTVLAHLQIVRKGEGVSYGHRYHTPEDRVIGTLPVGYADGYMRALGGRAEVLIRGRRYPVVGRVCMDACMVDLGSVKDWGHTQILEGDPVILWGRDPSGTLSIEALADAVDTIPYELMCNLSKRVYRSYEHEDGRPFVQKDNTKGIQSNLPVGKDADAENARR